MIEKKSGNSVNNKKILLFDFFFFAEEGVNRRRQMQCRKLELKVPLRLIRLCVLGTFLPAILIAGPIYLRYRVYSVQLYPLTISDQRLIDGKISTTWCQVQYFYIFTIKKNESKLKSFFLITETGGQG